MGVLRFRPDTKAVYLASCHPGLTPQDVADATGFPLEIEGATETPPPSPEVLRILRQEVDPERIFLR
jgi:glutaconate CoA-transferase subunit B